MAGTSSLANHSRPPADRKPRQIRVTSIFGLSKQTAAEIRFGIGLMEEAAPSIHIKFIRQRTERLWSEVSRSLRREGIRARRTTANRTIGLSSLMPREPRFGISRSAGTNVTGFLA